jgi:pyruvate dehydrogenase E2 component (dihydrolipoamide acetyltransferase)
MPIKILMPALSPTMTEGNLARWLKKEGDTVKSGDVIAEIETDKATMEVEAADEGTLGKIVVPEGTEGVKVNEVIGLLLEEGEDKSALASVETKSAPAAPKPAAATPKTEPAPAPKASPPAAAPTAPGPVARSNGNGSADVIATPLARRMAALSGVQLSAVSGTGAHGKITKEDVEHALSGGERQQVRIAGGGTRVFASPLARRLAREMSVDIGAIPGSGPQGRVIKLDVERAKKEGVPQRPAGAPQRPAARAPGEAAYEDVKVSMMRRVIAERLSESKRTIPHYYLTVDCEIDQLMASRAQLNGRPGHDKLSVNDFIILAVARAMRDHPQVNASWIGDNMIRHYHSVDVSIAVALEDGLVTPIIRDADLKSIDAISAEMKSLADKAKKGRLVPEEYQGGAFSISNLGMFGIKQFEAVINPPQSGILAIGAGEPRAVVKDGKIVSATVMSMTLSGDHRVIDGATGAKFLTAVKGYLEAPLTMFVS